MLRYRLLVLACVGVLLSASGVQAQSPVDTTVYRFSTNRLELGQKNSDYGIWIDFGKIGRLASNPEVQLVVSVSELLRNDLSNLTLMVNGLPTLSRRLSVAEGDTMVWNMRIPRHVLADGYNNINLLWRLSTGEDPCADKTNPALWLTIEPSSRITALYTSDGFQLSDFPRPFVYADSEQPVRFGLDVSDPESKAEVEAAIRFGASLGNLYRFSALPVRIGGAGTWNRTITFEQADAAAVDSSWTTQESGSYKLDWNSSGDSLRLRVLGTTPAALQNAVDRLFAKAANPAGNEAIAASGRIMSADTVGAKATFRDLGNGSTRLAGIFEQRGELVLRRPQHVKVGPGSYIDLIYSHTANLKEGTSSLTVLINDKPAASVALGDEDPIGRHLRVPIPTEELTKPLWIIQFVAYHDFGNIGDIDCSATFTDAVWTEISDLSEVRFGLGTFDLEPDLARLPWLQPTRAEQDTVAFWMDFPARGSLLQTAVQMAVRAAQVNGDAFQAVITTESPEPTLPWVIHLSGGENSETWSAFGNDWLWKPDTRAVEGEAVFQTFRRPPSNQIVYSIYADEVSGARVSRMLAYPDSVRLIEGRVVTLRADGTHLERIDQRDVSLVYSDDKTTFYLLVGGLALLLGITVGIGYFIRHKRRQPRFKPIG